MSEQTELLEVYKWVGSNAPPSASKTALWDDLVQEANAGIPSGHALLAAFTGMPIQGPGPSPVQEDLIHGGSSGGPPLPALEDSEPGMHPARLKNGPDLTAPGL